MIKGGKIYMSEKKKGIIKEQKKMSEGDGFSLLGEEDMNGFGDFTSDDADEDLW